MKLYLHIEGNDEDTFITALIEAAKEYLKNAGVTVQSGTLYDLALKLLVSHWYENREVETIGKNISKISFSLDTIIAQLKYCYEDTTATV
jgi:uncharacterized phage protein (predicted DNA packaging)